MRTIKMIILAGMLLPGLRLHAQAIYIDPTTSGAMAVHSGIINSQLNKTNDNLTLIQRGQLAVTGQLLIVNDLQSQIYKGLSEVSAVVRNLLAVRDIVEIGGDIVEDVNKAINIAGSNPALLLFAEGGAREFRTRATNLATEVGSFVLSSGKENLMDSGERAKLLNRIVTEMTILRGVAYGMYRSMYWAKQRGILNALNPYAGFINIDKQIADNIIRNVKYLKQ
ncbi:hypothetical protein SAMN05216464_11315 [Mucilaginibacter pineti]|uniref:DUF4197 domain-containing protein n=1 Tax=Mucilaginibacter pineti TaxID=1391627 RepID=A0A1G7IH05_9SPHI|nr:hypothetical protein [Mucilaginibacter pineti]SDF11589.1 hypothetical protein SAMN05216464_11315 [Mucilaginibacter pineti]